ncbi:NAD(P)H-binding protein [Streptomyces sp. NPDC049954]|uniref:NAD(P)-dependent oxidoreductase n=1 Tax=Streptomyces sp. NPDC049954 TaxID=3155779 RepID=UPI0034405C5E
MTRITVLGGTGYAGGAVAAEAAARGHEVVAFSRHAGEEPHDKIASVTGSALKREDLELAVADSQVVVCALAAVGELEDRFEDVVREIAGIALARGARLGVVGGAGSLLAGPDGPKVFDTPEFPAQFRAHSLISDTVLEALRSSDPALDWFVLSPPLSFGRWAPGEKRGTFRIGGDVLLKDDEDRSTISGADFAAALVDEIERPAHRRARFTVAY